MQEVLGSLELNRMGGRCSRLGQPLRRTLGCDQDGIEKREGQAQGS